MVMLVGSEFDQYARARTIKSCQETSYSTLPCSTNHRGIDILDVLHVTKNGDVFMFPDSGADDPEKFIIYTTKFPETQMNGCLFHLCQSIWRRAVTKQSQSFVKG